MPTYIDESGDTGSISSGGKPYFRLAAVWVPSMNEARSFQDELRRLREQFRLSPTYEFKFSKTISEEIRKGFFSTVLRLSRDFRFVFVQVDKSLEYWSLADGDEQIWACATELAVALRPLYHQAEQIKQAPLKEYVIVDDNSHGVFLETIKRQFSALKSHCHPRKPLVKTVQFRKSHTDPMLQLVDMICGAVGSKMDGDPTWHHLIADREIDVLTRW